MADNWLTFSEVIPKLTSEEEAWLEQQLEAVAVIDGKEYPYELDEDEVDVEGTKVPARKAEFAGCRAYRDMEGYDVDQYGFQVGFLYEFQDDHDQPNGWGRHLWLYADKGSELDLLAHFVQKFLRNFRSSDCWSLTYATTCSKPRVGEFGGGAIFITASEIHWENVYDFVDKQRQAFEAQ